MRVIEDLNGQIWLRGVDVARALGYQDPARAIRTHIKNTLRKAKLRELSLPQTVLENANKADKEAIWISESGCYDLGIASQTELAESFRAWLTGDVLPKLRQTGTYSIQDQQMQEVQLDVQRQQLALELQREQVIEQRLKNRLLAMELARKARTYQEQTGLNLTSNQLQAERAVLNRAILPPEQADDTTITTAEYLRLRGHTDMEVAQLQGSLGRILKRIYRQVRGKDPDTTAYDDGGLWYECACYHRQLDKDLLNEAYQVMTLGSNYRNNVQPGRQLINCTSTLQ